MIKSDSGLMYTGIYRATVLRQEKFGKLKLYIYGVTAHTIDTYLNNQFAIDDLPDAEPAISLFGGTGETNGFISYPHIGATVWCFFENYDYLKPVYFATCPAGKTYNTTYNNLADNKGFTNTNKNYKSFENNIDHKLVIGNNHLTFNEDGHVVLEVNSKNNPQEYTTIDILPTTTELYVHNSY